MAAVENAPSHEPINPTMSATDAMLRSEVASAEVLRATTAGVALTRAGAIMRNTKVGDLNSGNVVDQYEKSFAVKIMDYFWSHSWRADAWQKVITLLVFHNSTVAAPVSVLCAILASVYGWPNIVFEQPDVPESKVGAYDNYWPSKLFATAGGFVSFLVTIFLWRSSATVFLDKICISQTNNRLKEDGIKSLGGFLRYSKQCLILFDKSYLTRLWCVFEVATVAKLKGSKAAEAIVMRPVRSGYLAFALTMLFTILLFIHILICPCANVDPNVIAVAELVSFLLVLVAMAIFVPYHYRRWVDEVSQIQSQVKAFSFNGAKCFCCDVDHIMPGTGAPIPCDRAMVRMCIEAWFGTVEYFDSFTRDTLGPAFPAPTSLPFRYALMVTLSRTWYMIGFIGAYIRDSPEKRVSFSFLTQYIYWWINLPLVLNLGFRTMKLFSRCPVAGWKGFAINMVSGLLGMLLFVIEIQLRAVVKDSGPIIFFGLVVVVLLMTILVYPELRAPVESLCFPKPKPAFKMQDEIQETRIDPAPPPDFGIDGVLVEPEPTDKENSTEVDFEIKVTKGGKVDIFV